MALTASLGRIRRFLRDIDGVVWSDSDLLVLWNEAQYEIAQKTGMIEKIENYYYPPVFNWSYHWEWEKQYTDGDRLRQCLSINEVSGSIVSYPWESFYWLSTLSTPDTGYRVTQQWEAFYCTPADVVSVLLNSQTDKIRFLAFDEKQLVPVLQRELAFSDPYYRTTEGEPTCYWKVDEYSNSIVIYPRPSSVVWQDTLEEDVFSDIEGIISSDEYWLDTGDYGITVDVIDSEDALLAIYDAYPFEVDNWVSGTSDFQDWLLKYVEYATLERAFGSDTDGYIPTLRDYWKQRKEIGIQAILRFKRMALADRDFRLGVFVGTARGHGGRLPAGYPAL
jgi:hypothetical protein